MTIKKPSKKEEKKDEGESDMININDIEVTSEKNIEKPQVPIPEVEMNHTAHNTSNSYI